MFLPTAMKLLNGFAVKVGPLRCFVIRNVVAIHDFSDGAGASSPAYIVMELLEGRSLRDLLDQEGRIAAERLVTLMRGVCSGVSAAHRKGVVHRDLKPDNIIIIPPERAGDPETVKVIDFGIAKLREADAGAGLTQTGVLIVSQSVVRHYVN